jgi:two-component system C4-dicarboxylate transport sensor histidine kinase DctB
MPFQPDSLIRSRRISRLFIIALALVLCFLVWQTASWTKQTSLSVLEEQARNQLRLYVSNLQGQLQKFEFLPELLATNKRLVYLLQNPADRERTEALNRYLESINSIANASDTYLMDAEGLTIAASNWQSERPFVGRNFSYRPYFKEAMKGHLGRYFALGTTSLKRGYYFAYPVRNEGVILGAVVIKINMAPIEESWSRSDQEFVVTDPDGVIFITTNKDWRYRTMQELAPETRLRITQSRRYADAGLEPLDIDVREVTESGAQLLHLSFPMSADYLMLQESMPEAGWKVHILASTKDSTVQVVRSVIVAAALVGIGVLFVLFWIQRQKRLHERARFERRVKKNLEANAARIRTILQNTQAGLMMTDFEGHIEFVNTKAEELFGYGHGEMANKGFFEYIVESQHGLVASGMNEDGDVFPITEVDAVRMDGTIFPVELAMGTIYLHDGPRRLATFHDISYRKKQEEALRQAHDQLETRVQNRTKDLTAANVRLMREIEEHRRTEEALRQTQDELIQAAKMAALGQMSTGISHELNQPLAAIRSYADNARALLGHERKEDAVWNLSQISELTERMAQISSQLKVFARKTSGQVVSVSVPAVVENTLKILRPRIKETQTEIVQRLPQEELFVLADMVQLEQVLVNLIGNALHAVEAQEVRQVEVEARLQDAEVIISIRDSGRGIEEENLPRIFDPFFTTKEEGRGLGLGLSISYRIMESMNGVLSASNHSEGGAVFTVHLPTAEKPLEKAGVAF